MRATIGLPVWNGENYLEAALDAISEQSVEQIEILVSDNASEDATEEICRAAARRDDRIRYQRLDRNEGAAANYNRVLHDAAGPYFKWAAHDDLVHPQFLERCLAEFEHREPEVALVYPAAQLIDEVGVVIKPLDDRTDAGSRWASARVAQSLQGMSRVNSVFGVFRTDVLRRTRGIGPFISSDYVLLLEVALLGKIVKLDGDPLFSRRVHPGMSRLANVTDADVQRWFDPNTTGNRRRLHREYLRSVWSVQGLGVPNRIASTVALGVGVTTKRARVAIGRSRRSASRTLMTGSADS